MTNQTQKKSVYVHTLFGFKEPLEGFEQPLLIEAVPSTFVPAKNEDYVFERDMVARVLRSYAARENMMFTGEKGTGKSSFVQQVCARLHVPLMSINGGPGLDETYLMGSKTLENGSVKAVDGVLSYCVRHGIAVLIDEIAAIKPSVMVSINDVLNGDEVITLKHHGLDATMKPEKLAEVEGSMTIRRNPRFRFFATDNTGGKVGRDSRYNGVNTQNSAVRSRFTCFKMGFMKPGLELKALIASTKGALPVVPAKMMVELAIRIRAAFEIGEMSDTMSFRELQRWGRKSLIYGAKIDNGVAGAEIRPEFSKSFVDAVYTGLEESDQALAAELFELAMSTKLELPSEYKLSASHFLDQLNKGTVTSSNAFWDDVA